MRRDKARSHPLAFLDAVVEAQDIGAEQSSGRCENQPVMSDATMNAPHVFFEP